MYGNEINPLDVAKALDAHKVKYVLVGGHAVNGFNGRPRTTVDVDLVALYPKKAVTVLLAAFPHLKAKDTPVVIRLSFEDGKEAVDVLKPEPSKLLRRLLSIAKVHPVPKIGKLRIPPVEGVLAAKFAAMISLGRRAGDRMQDAADFIHIVEANEKLNEELLKELGELVYEGGATELLKLLAKARAGETLDI